MSTKPLASGYHSGHSGKLTSQESEAVSSSCSARVLVLIDVGPLANQTTHPVQLQKPANTNATKYVTTAPAGRVQSPSTQNTTTAGAAAAGSTGFIDALRISILRVLSQLSLSCAPGTCVEWAPRFFDSRHSGVGKTPAELRARLRSRLQAQGGQQSKWRGFTRLTQESFRAFGDTCLAVACGVQGDPLARDRQAALRRWSHGRKHDPRNRVQNAGAGKPRSTSSSRDGKRPSTCAGDSLAHGNEGDGPGRMYDGHDMSSHEVVVRSLLEVLQEFGEASDGEREVDAPLGSSSHDSGRLLLLLHSFCPQTEEEVERFALGGNFTTKARRLAAEPPEKRATTLVQTLNDGLGKAILRARSRRVSFHWQDALLASDHGDRTNNASFSSGCGHRGITSLDRCVSAAGSSCGLRWELEAENARSLPPSLASGSSFRLDERGVKRNGLGPSGAGLESVPPSDGIARVAVAVSLSGQGAADAQLVAARLSGPFSGAQEASLGEVTGTAAPRGESKTPWRLMGTLPLSDVWPGVLEGQRWRATVALRAVDGDGAVLWRELLGCLLSGGLTASITLPRRLFEVGGVGISGDIAKDRDAPDALTVALLMPISGDCAIGWNMANETVNADTRGQSTQIRPSDTTAASHLAQPLPSARDLSSRMAEVERTQKMRQAEVGLAFQESAIARKRRRHTKALPAEHMRRMSGARASTAAGGLGGRFAALGGGPSGPLSPRDSVSLCFTGEDMGGEVESELSHATGSPPSFCLLGAAMGATGSEDERESSWGSSSGPRRALHQALEDASSRSSLFSRDADCSSTPGSKEGSSLLSGLSLGHRLESEAQPTPRKRVRGEAVGGLFGSAIKFDMGGGSSAAVDLAPEPVRGGVSQLPLSFMSEPALACLPAAPLPTEVVTLAERCALDNDLASSASADVSGAAASAATAAAATSTTTSIPHQRAGATLSKRSSKGMRKERARRLFIAAVRAAEQKDREAAGLVKIPVPIDPPAPPAPALATSVLTTQDCREDSETRKDGVEATQGKDPKRLDGEQEGCVADKSSHPSVAAVGQEGCVTMGVAGLRRQYLEVVEGGQRSPVEFVVRTVPEAIRDLADKACAGNAGKIGGSNTPRGGDGDRHARASALVLAAVVSGLTASPEELGAKHRANKKSKIAAPEDATAGMGMGSNSAATPALQKVRDYQLQALLLCQLNTLAMDLPDTPETLAVFSALATSRTATDGKPDDDENTGSKDKDKKKKKKKRKRKRAKDEDSAPIRPCDPLPRARRTRLESFLQPISTMLDACTVTRAVPSAGDAGGGGGGDSGTTAQSGGGVVANGFNPRAYDGTMADFMGIGLVEHFASRLPRTLAALFEDFERHPPESLTAALASAAAATSATSATAESCSAPSGDSAAAMVTAASRLSEVRDGSKKDAGAGRGKEAAPPGVDVAEPAAPFAGAARATADPIGTSANPRVNASAGILLSDRSSMSHNHFKMSGVLNGFREIKLKRQATSGGLRPAALTEGQKRKQTASRGGGTSMAAGGKGAGQNEGWRRSGSAGGGRGSRSRAARDAKTTGSVKAPPTRAPTANTSTVRLNAEVRHSPPCLSRKRPGNNDGATGERGDANPHTAQKSSTAGAPPASSHSNIPPTNQSRKRRQIPGKSSASPVKNGIRDGGGKSVIIVPRTRSGVLVGETPRKRKAAGAGAARASRQSRTGGGGSFAAAVDAASADDRGRYRNLAIAPESPVAGAAAAAATDTTANVGKGRGCPSAILPSNAVVAASPAGEETRHSEGARATRRQRGIMDSPCLEDSGRSVIARPREVMPSPPCWRTSSSASAASRLFVEESPTGAGGASSNGGGGRSGSRSEWALAGSGGGGSGIFRQLATESASSPLPQRRSVVPDTPVC